MSCISWLKPTSKKKSKDHQQAAQSVSDTPLDIPGGLAGIRQRMAEMGHFMNHASPVGDDNGSQRSHSQPNSVNGKKSNGESAAVNGTGQNSYSSTNPNLRRSPRNGGSMAEEKDSWSGGNDKHVTISADFCTEDGRAVKPATSFASLASDASQDKFLRQPARQTSPERESVDWKSTKPPIPTPARSISAEEDKDFAGMDQAINTFMEKKREEEQKKERAARKRAMFLASMDRSDDSSFSQSQAGDEPRPVANGGQQDERTSKSGTPIPPTFPTSDQLRMRSGAAVAINQPPPPPAQAPPSAFYAPSSPRHPEPPVSPPISLAQHPSPHRPSPPPPALDTMFRSELNASETFSPTVFRLPRAHEREASMAGDAYRRPHSGEDRGGSEADNSLRTRTGYSNPLLHPHSILSQQSSSELSAPSDLQRQLQDLRRMQSEIETFSTPRRASDYSMNSPSSSFTPYTPKLSVPPLARQASPNDSSFQDSIPAKMAAFKRQHPNGSFHQWLLRLTPEDITRAISTSNGGTGIWRQMWDRISPYDNQPHPELAPSPPPPHQRQLSPYHHMHLDSSLYSRIPQGNQQDSSHRLLNTADVSPSFADSSYHRNVQHSPPLRQVFTSEPRQQLGSSHYYNKEAAAAGSYSLREPSPAYQRQLSPSSLSPPAQLLGPDRSGFVSFRAMNLLGPTERRAEGRKWQYPASPQLDLNSTSSNFERRALHFAGSQV